MCEILKCYTIIPIEIYLQKRTDVCIRLLDFLTHAHRQIHIYMCIDQTVINCSSNNDVSAGVPLCLSKEETSCKELTTHTIRYGHYNY
jgi:hypothetical protein